MTFQLEDKASNETSLEDKLGSPNVPGQLQEMSEPVFGQLGPSSLTLCSLELEMLRLASEGLVDKRAAVVLQIDPNRVHERWRRIRNVLSAKTRTHAVAIALSLGIIPSPEKVRKRLSDGH